MYEGNKCTRSYISDTTKQITNNKAAFPGGISKDLIKYSLTITLAIITTNFIDSLKNEKWYI